jgi:hypothetical protein
LEIQKLHRDLGITSLFVTQDQFEAVTLAPRMIVMNWSSSAPKNRTPCLDWAAHCVPPRARTNSTTMMQSLANDWKPHHDHP